MDGATTAGGDLGPGEATLVPPGEAGTAPGDAPVPPAVDDAELARRAATGDRAAFAAIVERYAGRLHDVLWWALGDHHRATDVLAATVAEAAARLHQLGDPDRLRPWLFAVARHQLAAAGADAPPDAPRPGAPDAPDGDGPAAGTHPLAAALAAAAAGLAPHDRLVLDLSLRQGLPDDELGDALGLEAGEARALASQVEADAEEALGRHLVAGPGRAECGEIGRLLSGCDGVPDKAWRKRVDGHVATCETCRRTRARAAGAALVAVAPSLGLDPAVGDELVRAAPLGSHGGRAWAGPPPGFPPAAGGARARPWSRNRLFVPVAAAVLVLVGVVALLSAQRDTSLDVAAGRGTTLTTVPGTAGEVRSPPTGVTTVPADGSSTTAAPSTTAAGPATSAARNPTAPAGNDTTASPNVPTVPRIDPTVPTTPATPAPDRQGPRITDVVVAPTEIRGRAPCGRGDFPPVVVTARVTDASGVREVSVIVVPAQDDPVTMAARGGDVYSATVSGLSFPVSIEAAVLVSATDGAGNTSVADANLKLTCGA